MSSRFAARRIAPNDSTATPSNHIFCDAETNSLALDESGKERSEVLRLWCGRSYHREYGERTRRKMMSGTTTQEFWEWVDHASRRRESNWIWAHNSKVDATWLGFWDMIDRGKIKLLFAVLESPPFIVGFTYNGKRFNWVDTLNWFRCSLRALGDTVGLPKMEMPPREESDRAWKDYCMRDVEIIEEAVYQLTTWVKENDLGQFRSTVASQAWHAFRHWAGDMLPFVHDEPAISAHEREGNHGGRCEMFFQGTVRQCPMDVETHFGEKGGYGPEIVDEDIYVLDVRSMYPSVMRDNRYPKMLVGDRTGMSTSELKRIVDDWGAMSRVKINTRRAGYPCRTDRGVIYPIGEFWTTLATPELRYALDNHDIDEVGYTTVYKMDELFTGFVDRMYSLRDQSDKDGSKVWSDLCKILLNSLHGKFGQRSGGWKDLPGEVPKDRWAEWFNLDMTTGNHKRMRSIGDHVQVKEEQGEHKDAIVSIPAHVSSYARVLMRHMMDDLPPRTLLYTDTDSLHVLEEGYRALVEKGWVDDRQIGMLEVKKIVKHVEYRGAKAYRIGDEFKVSGVPGSGEKVDRWTWKHEDWEGISTIIAQGPKQDIRVKEVLTSLSGAYMKGAVGEDGWVKPFVMKMEEDDPDPF